MVTDCEKILVIHMNAYKEQPQSRRVLVINCERRPVLWIGWPLSPVIPVLAQ